MSVASREFPNPCTKKTSTKLHDGQFCMICYSWQCFYCMGIFHRLRYAGCGIRLETQSQMEKKSEFRNFGICTSCGQSSLIQKVLASKRLLGYTLVHTIYFFAHLFLGCSEVVPAPLPAPAPLAHCSRAGPVVVHLAALADQLRWPIALVLPLGQGRR